MKLYYNWFYNPERHDFKRMKEVFDYSLKKNNKNIEIIEEHLEYPEQFKELRPVHFENVYKLRKWNDYVQNLTEESFLTDCDMMCMGDISEIKKDINTKELKNKHVYFTTRPEKVTNIRCNAGVVYVKPTKEVKEFFKKWLEVSEMFDPREHYWATLLNIYKGATQTALGSMWDEYKDIIGEIPCLKWNATVFEWGLYNPDQIKFIHVKSNLRMYIMQNIPEHKMGRDGHYLYPLQQYWYDLEKEMLKFKEVKNYGKSINCNINKRNNY